MKHTTVDSLTTPALLVDRAAFDHNLNTMMAVRPGLKLRPHVKAFKSTAVARVLHDAGHTAFTCATIGEVEGLAAAGLGHDLLLANEVLDARRLGAISNARVTVAVDSDRTVHAAADAGVKEVVIDVNVGLPRCGCAPEQAGALAELARRRGLTVRGVMGYEGHIMAMTDRTNQTAEVEKSMQLLLLAHDSVGGELISAGGTGTFDINHAATEIQAGSYLFMDTQYAELGLPFREALTVLATIISTNNDAGYVVANAGLKALGMDHGNPTVDNAKVWFCSDEHITLGVDDPAAFELGDHIRVRPAHVDPTIAKHPTMWVTEGDRVIDSWPVDLMHW